MAENETRRGGCLGCLTSIFKLTLVVIFVAIAFPVILAVLNDDVTPSNVTPSNERFVTAEQFGDAWPLTVESGTLRCERGIIVVFVHNGQRYAMNGTARRADGVLPTEEIWKNNPELPGTKIVITPLIQAGLELCD